ncbi:pentapeptide repeat-containing protein [Paracoccus marinaquae]|uniref:Pentapeptide repeat-containing protein n=1 Tax=Paracoccus marinaquae TaxID=2841926 RepID=A0ABS6AN31_9RHOB|nr:pentapeptide repeat-containing protein [Paracoccus marinaquae]MBU3031601.1 pentapeptide repeat-containing protein [Paracoccus marinaquae]
MRNDASLQTLVDPGDLEAAFEAVAATSGEFSEACIALGLDPARDFRCSNLRDADFSKADLRGFDFRGADLRGSYGADVIFDSSTNFEGADLQGSCFATYYRELRLFKDNPMADRMYRTLLEGDPFEISSWFHARYRNQRERHSILKKADKRTAAILCQKLLADDIDLTKRTDLFYFLRSFTSSRTELHELMLSIFARQSENTPLIEKFTTIASSLHGHDSDVRNLIVQLCAAKSPRVRLSAFKASANTGIFMQNFESMKGLFLRQENAGLRKELILEAAIRLGRNHLAAVNRLALLDDVKAEDVLDLSELFEEAAGTQISAAITHRLDAIEARLNPHASHKKKISSKSSPVTPAIIYERQAEVLYSAPVLRTIFARDDPIRSMAARARLANRREHKEKQKSKLPR